MTSSPAPKQARRWFVVGALSALVLAGCATGPRLGSQAPRGPQLKEVALLVPLTGEDAPVGQGIANAARLALTDTNTTDIQLTLFNTAEGGAAAAASRAIAGGAKLILGPLLSDQVRAVAPIARSARVPVLSYSNDVTAAGNGVYILGFVPGQAMARVVQHARANGAMRFAAVAPNTLYGQRSVQGLVAAVQQSGGQLSGVDSYATADQARAAIRRLNARGGFDTLLIADGARAAAAIAPSVRRGVRIIGPDLWAGERTLGRTTRLRGAWYAAPSDTRFEQLVSRYRARYGSVPVRLASLGYDSMLLTIRAARGWRLGRRFPVAALGDQEGFLGVDGVFRFGRDGVAQRGLEVRQVTASGSSVSSPAPTSF